MTYQRSQREVGTGQNLCPFYRGECLANFPVSIKFTLQLFAKSALLQVFWCIQTLLQCFFFCSADSSFD